MHISVLRNTLSVHDTVSVCQPGVSDLENPEVKTIKVAKEALVSKENIADDTLGDEDWNVISASRSAILLTCTCMQKFIFMLLEL